MTKLITTRAELLHTLHEFRSNFAAREKALCSVGFVPTMGALHEGHRELIRKCVAENDFSVVSIFVNPKQFGPQEDFGRYPRVLEEDYNLCRSDKVNIVFAPSVEEMYPESFLADIVVSPHVKTILCGKFRPTHFDGVVTVVTLLLNLVGPQKAYFGQKDFQQFFIIRNIMRSFAHPAHIIPVTTVREADGLAMSSRNRYLAPEARHRAKAIPRALALCAQSFLQGEKNVENLLTLARKELEKYDLSPQYFEIRQTSDLEICQGQLKTEAVVAIAQPIVYEGVTTRLIDNIILGEDTSAQHVLTQLIQQALNG